MKKIVSDTTKSHPFAYQILFRTAGILLVLTMLSIWLVCGLYARYTVSDNRYDSAKVAGMAGIELKEVAITAISDVDGMLTADRIYQFNGGTTNEIAYDCVVPGVDIPKNPYIVLDGRNDVACYLYIEVTDENVPDTVTYSIREEWTALEGVTGKEGGKVYCYRDRIEAHESFDKIEILQNNTIYVSQYYSAQGEFGMHFCGYLIQAADGYDAKSLCQNYFKEGESV